MSLALIGSIGTPELLIILFVALLMFGGRLPDVARSLGKSFNQFKRGLKDVEDEVARPDAPPPPRSLPTPPEATQARDPVATTQTPQG
jgi:sec-independent protein translocase protein TatA